MLGKARVLDSCVVTRWLLCGSAADIWLWWLACIYCASLLVISGEQARSSSAVWDERRAALLLTIPTYTNAAQQLIVAHMLTNAQCL